MSPGGRDGGKHWTKAEIESRAEAQKESVRRKRITLKPPDWLSDEALKVWKDLKKKLKDIELLDNLDTEMLAIYCDAIVHYRETIALLNYDRVVTKDGRPVFREDIEKAAQSWARIIANYADKLGLSPAGRARLAKKKAEKVVDEFEDKFGG
jgi:P27 family predicted phage terminase small subunit